MEWMQIIVMLVAILGLFAWNRAEGRADNRAMQALMSDTHKEMKEFHARLCVLEERYLQLMQKIWEKKE